MSLCGSENFGLRMGSRLGLLGRLQLAGSDVPCLDNRGPAWAQELFLFL
jgi:hypothetical protein